MVIDYKSMEEKTMPGFKGGEGVFNVKMFSDDLGKIMHGRLEPGCSIGMHTHETNSEIVYILSGEADILYDEGHEIVTAGQCHYCPMGHAHSMRNLGKEDLVFFAIVPELAAND